jgi:glyceraldehyde 3-phosphate dehydrogenase
MKNIMINGFGRIGKTFLRTCLLNDKARKKINIAAINIGPGDQNQCALLFKYDSIMPEYQASVSYTDGHLTIDNQRIKIFTETDPAKLPHNKLGIDWVVEASGLFTNKKKAHKHIDAGAKKVLITAPADDSDITIIPGVNDEKYQPDIHNIVSLGSCTTNAVIPLIKIIHNNFDITSSLITTIHAYTNDQVLLDIEHKDPRRARAANLNIIPTKTGADKVITQLFPELEKKIHALAIRVPVPVSSLIDFAFTTSKTVSIEAINNAIQYSSENDLKDIVQYIQIPLVSSDFIGNAHSCIVDSLLTQSAGNLCKVFAWYDNEYGYSSRLKDFLITR